MGISFSQGGVAQMVECSLSMREILGWIPSISRVITTLSALFHTSKITKYMLRVEQTIFHSFILKIGKFLYYQKCIVS